jgi:hypothetical protein
MAKCKALAARRQVYTLWHTTYVQSQLPAEKKDPIWNALHDHLKGGRWDDDLAKAENYRACQAVLIGVQKLKEGKSAIEVNFLKQAKREEKLQAKQADLISTQLLEVEHKQARSELSRLEDEQASLARMEALTDSAQQLAPFMFSEVDELMRLRLPHVDVIWYLDIAHLLKNGEGFIKHFMGPHSMCFCFCLFSLN